MLPFFQPTVRNRIAADGIDYRPYDVMPYVNQPQPARYREGHPKERLQDLFDWIVLYAHSNRTVKPTEHIVFWVILTTIGVVFRRTLSNALPASS